MALIELDSIADKAIAIPSDDSALREYGAKLVEDDRTKIGEYLERNDCYTLADKIRKGEF